MQGLSDKQAPGYKVAANGAPGRSLRGQTVNTQQCQMRWMGLERRADYSSSSSCHISAAAACADNFTAAVILQQQWNMLFVGLHMGCPILCVSSAETCVYVRCAAAAVMLTVLVI